MSHIPIIVYYHCLFRLGDPPEILPHACAIVREQMHMLQVSGLLDACSEFHVGINGNEEDLEYANLFIPPKAKITLHGLASRAENLTIIALHEWSKKQGGERYILYFHSKGATHAEDSGYAVTVANPWRRAMMNDLVMNWQGCIAELDNGFEIVTSRWLWNMADGSQHIPIGNFLFVRANFVKTLPDMRLRERLRISGVAGLESRYESEVFWGNGPRRPNVKSWRPQGGGGIP